MIGESKVKTAAVICEYNPFHNGHKYQLDMAKKLTECSQIAVLMSGNYVQRGDFAIYSKSVRAKAALAAVKPCSGFSMGSSSARIVSAWSLK